MNTIRTILSLDTSYKWEIYQMDVKILFLNGDIHEFIYTQQPPSFVTAKTSNLVCKLKIHYMVLSMHLELGMEN